jgi:hypothetical protein
MLQNDPLEASWDHFAGWDPAYRFGLTNLVKYSKMASLAGSGYFTSD